MTSRSPPSAAARHDGGGGASARQQSSQAQPGGIEVAVDRLCATACEREDHEFAEKPARCAAETCAATRSPHLTQLDARAPWVHALDIVRRDVAEALVVEPLRVSSAL